MNDRRRDNLREIRSMTWWTVFSATVWAVLIAWMTH